MKFIIPLILNIALVYSQCANYGKKCPKTSPCCKDGWCSSDMSFCSAGCQPENSYAKDSCLPRYYCKNLREDFDDYKLINANQFSGNPEDAEFVSSFQPDYASVEDGKLKLELKLNNKLNSFNKTQGFGSTVEATRFMEYGKVTARIKTGSTNPGIVSAFITKSPEGDEIDFEWVGKSPKDSQTNFYFDGKLDYFKMKPYGLGFDTTADYHIYELDWTPDYLKWSIDDKVVRQLTKNETFDAKNNIYHFPNQPSQIGFGLWDGGRAEQGTIEWAGSTDWSNKEKVYSMYVDWVEIDCFYKGNDTIDFKPRANSKNGQKGYSLKNSPSAVMILLFSAFTLFATCL